MLSVVKKIEEKVKNKIKKQPYHVDQGFTESQAKKD